LLESEGEFSIRLMEANVSTRPPARPRMHIHKRIVDREEMMEGASARAGVRMKRPDSIMTRRGILWRSPIIPPSHDIAKNDIYCKVIPAPSVQAGSASSRDNVESRGGTVFAEIANAIRVKYSGSL